jgi:hypothetical protein
MKIRIIKSSIIHFLIFSLSEAFYIIIGYVSIDIITLTFKL